MTQGINFSLEKLTSREKDVFMLISKGLSNKACANVLGISQRTVEVHRANILHKYNVRSIAQLSYLIFWKCSESTLPTLKTLQKPR